MKIILSTLALVLVGFTANAGSTVCAGKTMYYSDVNADMGFRPPAGMIIGTLTIVADGEVLLKRDEMVGGGQYSINEYSVDLSEDAVLIKATGNQFSGTNLFETTATLYKVNSKKQSEKIEIKSEPVVCKKTWRMAI